MNTIYVSYDGASDPLGQSQVVPYLVGLARAGLSITLVSFEKPERMGSTGERRCRQILESARIRWIPLRYHKRPRLPATLWDIAAGGRWIRKVARSTGARLVHCRGDVAMAMARAARLGGSAKLLYDVRGFFADERTAAGSWRAGSLLDRLVRSAERHNLACADGLVVLTNAALSILEGRNPLPRATRVIPTCVDLDRFVPSPNHAPPQFGFVYVGSLGTWYRTREMIEFGRVAAEILDRPSLFLTPDRDAVARAGLATSAIQAVAVEPEDVPAWLARCSATFFFILPKPAACPTKLGEALACGLPVVANRGIGDVEDILRGRNVGIVLDDFDEETYRHAARQIHAMIGDPRVARHCRQLAEERLGLAGGIASYRALYEELGAGPSVSR